MQSRGPIHFIAEAVAPEHVKSVVEEPGESPDPVVFVGHGPELEHDVSLLQGPDEQHAVLVVDVVVGYAVV